MTMVRRHVLMALIAFVAALAGVVAGRVLVPSAPADERSIHSVLHDRLDLDDAQRVRIEALEHSFAQRKRQLEDELRADNARLAKAIAGEHGYGPGVGAAVDQSHHAMGELQKATLQHIFAMRAVLRADQAAKFDDAVVKALTATDG